MRSARCYDAGVRTTVNIDEQLLAEAKVHAARSRRSMTSLLEDALRRYLEEAGAAPSVPIDLPEFVPSTPGLRPGVDLDDREQLADLLGDNERV